MPKIALTAAALFAALALSAAPAGASTGVAAHVAKRKPATVKTVIRDCSRDGRLNRHYSTRLLRKTLKKIPFDLDTYTDCKHVIRKAIRRQTRHRH